MTQLSMIDKLLFISIISVDEYEIKTIVDSTWLLYLNERLITCSVQKKTAAKLKTEQNMRTVHEIDV